MKTKRVSGVKIITLILSLFLITVFIGGCGDSSAEETSTEGLKNGMNITLTSSLPSCATKDNLNKLDNAMSQQNENLKNSMLESGEVVVIDSGANIDIIDLGALTTKIQYNSSEYYVHTDMISK